MSEMSEAIESAPIVREVQVCESETLRLTLADCGLFVWLESSAFPHRFPLSVGRDADWRAVQGAIGSIRDEAVGRARMENIVSELLDPIGGPEGEA